MVIHHAASRILTRIDKYFTLKPYSIGESGIYMGAKLRKTMLPNGFWFWSTSPSKYVQELVNNCEIHTKDNYNGKYALSK